MLTLGQYARTEDAELRAVAEKTLAGMAGGGMYDQYAGGFFRYSTTRDWSIPHYEKMLEDNARLTSVYAVASVVLNDPRWLDVVKSAHGWLLSDMRDPETGAFAGSQDADAEEHYYGQPLAVRATLPTPYIDRTVYAGWNFLMVSALVERYKLTGEPEILVAARKTFLFLQSHIAAATTNKHGDLMGIVNHSSVDGQVDDCLGFLTDQIAYVNAALDLHEVRGKPQHLFWATLAMKFVMDELEDAEAGGFYDIAPSPDAIGELARPKKDMTENAEAAIALVRLSALTEDDKYRRAAERALKVFAGEYHNHGYHAAAYARAVDAVTRPPLHIVIVGATDQPELWPLRQAAWNAPLPGKAVEWLVDGAERGFPSGKDGRPRAYVCLGTTCHVAATPQELTERLTSVS